MFSFTNFFAQFMSKFLTGFFTLEFSIFSLFGGVGRELPKTPSDFTPVLRFAVCSDVHLRGETESEGGKKTAEHFEKMLKGVNAYAEECSYDKLDALMVVGDMTNGGAPEEYEQFNAILDENLKDETQRLIILGNHEFIDYRDYDPTIGYDMFKKYIREDVDDHRVINGYHFIGVSYSDDAKTFNGKTAWLKSEIKKAVADTGDKPVFVYQHPQPFNTVYGSVNWGSFEMKTALVGFPQVVDFSGHSHYANTDPRSIWQGAFTAIGTGSTAALMGNLNYISGDEDAPGESGACWIVEVDADGNIRLKVYDVVNDKFFENNEYYLSDVAKQSAHRYTWGNLKSHDTAPVFPENAQIGAVRNENGNVSLTFPDAQCFWGAENYKIVVKNGGSEVYAGTVISNYVRTVSDGMSADIGNIPAGEYKVSITPYSPYAKGGKAISGTITVE